MATTSEGSSSCGYSERGRCRKTARDGRLGGAGEHVLDLKGVVWALVRRMLGDDILGVNWVRRGLLERPVLPLSELAVQELLGRCTGQGDALPDVEPDRGISSTMGRKVQREEAWRGARQSSGGAFPVVADAAAHRPTGGEQSGVARDEEGEKDDRIAACRRTCSEVRQRMSAKGREAETRLRCRSWRSSAHILA